MSLAGEESTTILDMGGADYAFKKLRRWKAERPTERNRRMAQFLIDHGDLDPSTEESSLVIDLALEWGDFAMWQEVLDKGLSEEYEPQLMSDILIRAWGIFTFDRTKKTLVQSTLALFSLLTSPFDEPRRIERVICDQHDTQVAVSLINVLQAHASEQPSVEAWLKQQAIAALSSIESCPSVSDIPMFVSVAKSEGILFFSKTCVLVDGRNDLLS